MHSTRHLLTTAAAARSLQRAKIPPRNPLDTWSSALSACLSFIDEQSREKFMTTVSKGIINPPVLGQANGGFASILALHHDLNSPLFRHSDTFDVEEFMDGVDSALENYEEVLTSLESRDFTSLDASVIDGKEKERIKNTSESNDNENLDNCDGVTETAMGSINVAAAMAAEATGIVTKKVDWTTTAKKSPESLEGQLAGMVSEQCFDVLQNDKRRILLHGNKRMNYIENSSEVQNVALLSARAVEISPEDNDTKNNKIKDGGEDPMSDVSFSSEIDNKYPVIAEMEVLYSVAQTFVAKPLLKSESNEDGSDENEHTLSSVWVGMFEGWIRDDESNEVQWKLAKNRPASEFPGLGLVHS